MNIVRIHYCYPTSPMAKSLGVTSSGGFYVTIGNDFPISGTFKTINGAEGFCRNHCLTWERHGYIPKAREAELISRQPVEA